MKKVSKAFLVVVAVFSMMLYTSAFASAASTTNLQDGVYSASTEPTKESNSVIRLNVVISEGTMTTSFGWFNGSMKIEESFADYTPEDQRESFIAKVKEIADYDKQLSNNHDGAKVVKFKDATEDSTVYETFQKLWASIVKDAGGTINEGGSASATDSGTANDSKSAAVTPNPKTGDSSMTVFYVLAAAAVSGIVLTMRRKQQTA